MNKFKATKYKTENLQQPNDSSLFDKITKRYSNVRFLRKSSNRKDAQAAAITGSYDMNGRNSDDHKLEIGAPILISKTTIDTDSIIDASCQFRNSVISDQQRSSNESDVYHDANSSLDTQRSVSSVGDAKFALYSSASNDDDKSDDNNATTYTKRRTLPTSIETNNYNSNNNNGKFAGNRSKSASNLHKTELSVYIQRSPSMELTHKFGNGIITTTTTTTTPTCNGIHVVSKQSIDSDISFHNSRNSVTVNGSIYDEEALDFDMKSASFQSLNARNIFLSIEELNDITRQINESDEFNVDTDPEYQIHRENLRPCERRITLLRNKNQSKFLNIAPKRDKLTNAWSGFKTWIGEEKGKIKDVVNKHAAMQRVGANTKTPNHNNDTVDGVTVFNGTALQLTQTASESLDVNDRLHKERTNSIDRIDNNQTRFNNDDHQHHHQQQQQRKVMGSESNDNHQSAQSVAAANVMKGKSLQELEVNLELLMIMTCPFGAFSMGLVILSSFTGSFNYLVNGWFVSQIMSLDEIRGGSGTYKTF